MEYDSGTPGVTQCTTPRAPTLIPEDQGTNSYKTINTPLEGIAIAARNALQHEQHYQ